MSGFPEPLTTPDCDLRGLGFMALDVVRLLDSDLFALSTGEEFKAAVALWCKSWSQVPAASLPNDDRILAHLSAAKQWKRVKQGAMRGWILCSDGRWYHPVVAEKAIEAMDRREEWQEANDNKKTRQQRWRERCKALGDELRALGVTPPRGASLETLEQMLVDAKTSTQASTQRDGRDNVEIGKTGIGTGIGINKERDSACEAGPADASGPAGDYLPNPTPYGAMAKLLRAQGIGDANPGNPSLRAWVDKGLTADEALAGLQAARATKSAPNPMAWPYLARVLETQRERAAQGVPEKSNRPPTTTERRNDWNAELRKVIDQADGHQPREIDMGVIDATGTHV